MWLLLLDAMYHFAMLLAFGEVKQCTLPPRHQHNHLESHTKHLTHITPQLHSLEQSQTAPHRPIRAPAGIGGDQIIVAAIGVELFAELFCLPREEATWLVFQMREFSSTTHLLIRLAE